MSQESKLLQKNLMKSEQELDESVFDEEVWQNVLAEYGPNVISKSEYNKTKSISPEKAGFYIISEVIACKECKKVIRAEHEPFTRDGVLDKVPMKFSLCQDHEVAEKELVESV